MAIDRFFFALKFFKLLFFSWLATGDLLTDADDSRQRKQNMRDTRREIEIIYIKTEKPEQAKND